MILLSEAVIIIIALLQTRTVQGDCIVQNTIASVIKLNNTVEERVDCHPDPYATPEKCEQRGCIWEPENEPLTGAPWCFYPPGYGYYMVGQPVETNDGFLIHLRKTSSSSMFGEESQDIWAQIEMQKNYRLRIKISDDRPRFQVPINIPSDGGHPAEPLYDISFTESPSFGIRVVRKGSGIVLLDTSLPGLIFSNQFIQLPMILPEGSHLYGWGENEQHTFSHDMNWKTWALYGRDQPPDGAANMYGVHPRLTVLDSNGLAYGILFLNSAAQEISLTPAPGLIYRTIGGILDMYIFMGEGPEEVVEQYTEAVGRFPLPPYWSLGFHLCRYGYDSLENMVAARERMEQFKIPQDAQWGDIDIMERALDFTVDQQRFGDLPQFVDDLKTSGVKFVTILDPCISTGEQNCTYRPFDLGELYDVWVKKASGGPVVGRVWPSDPVHFPDFTNPRTHLWWKLLLMEFHETIAYDGLWIDMNEPSNFVTGDLNDGCDSRSINYPPYLPSIRLDDHNHGLADKSLCGDAQHYLGPHYDVHNMFGWSQSRPTLEGVQEATGKRGLVLSRSTFVGSGNWVAHWLGDNFSNWANLRYSIIGMLQFNQFGIPMVGADICGFIGNTDEELCARWHQLGAFYPFSRNHNTIGATNQDPGFFGDPVARIARESLLIRYSLLPYLYTLFYHHAVKGGTVARPLWHEFPTDEKTRTIDDQFMWGSAILISPVVNQGQVSREIYLPTSSRWFSLTFFFNSSSWQEAEGGFSMVEAPLDVIHIHQRGGSIIPLQNPALNTQQSRKNDFQLLVALDKNQEANGTLFFDDGDTLDTVDHGEYFSGRLEYVERVMRMIVLQNGAQELQFLSFSRIVILGINDVVETVVVNGRPHDDFDSADGGVYLNNLDLAVNDNFKILFL